MAERESPEDDTIFEGENADGHNQNEEALSLDDITQSSIVTVDKGERIKLTVADVRKNYGGKYELSEVDYNIHIVDAEGEIFPINAWVLWNKVRQAFREAKEEGLIDSTAGLQLNIKRGQNDGEYDVKWKTEELDEWRSVDLDE